MAPCTKVIDGQNNRSLDRAQGKYNDGSPEARLILTQRIYDGIILSEQNLKREPVNTLRWATQDILPATDPKRSPTVAVITRPSTRLTCFWIARRSFASLGWSLK